MAKIDNLIRTLVEQGYPLASLHPDTEIMVDAGGQQQALGSRVMSAKQLEMVLDEVLTDEQRTALRREGRVELTHSCEAGSASILGFRRGGKLSIYVRVAASEPPSVSDPKPAKFARGATGKRASLSARAPTSLAADSDDDFLEGTGLDEASGFADATMRPSATGKAKVLPSTSASRSIPFTPPGTKAAIDKYLHIMFEQGCSDLHLTSSNPPLYRKDGDIVRLGDMPTLTPLDTERLIVPIMPNRNYEEFLELRDTDFAYEISGVGRFRVNVFMDRLGPGAVFRIIPDEILTAEQLNLPKSILDLCFLTKGLVVVTGPTGSGKSTTLAAMIDYLNRKRAAHLITIEDPIEFVHPNKQCLINQREVGVHTMGFKPALRAALREDPDVVLVGEMRDLETIAIAMETAETGHLVFGTLHTNTAPSTVDRIIDQFPPDRQSQIRTMLSESLRAVIAQTLCKKKGGGRVAALEVLMIDHAMSNLIREGKTFQIGSMMDTKKALGNVTLTDSLAKLVRDGVVEPAEAHLKSVDKAQMARVLKQLGHHVE